MPNGDMARAADRRGTITDVPGVLVGHWTNAAAGTGCTVLVFDLPAVAGVDVRVSAPGTRETDVLAVTGRVDRVDAIVLSGGSAFGLAAADGVMRWLERRGRGFPTPAGAVPIVPAAVIYDLGVGDATARPDAAAGEEAAATANFEPVPQGNVGAGTVAVVRGGSQGPAVKGGLGTALARDGEVLVGTVAVVNAAGVVHDPATRLPLRPSAGAAASAATIDRLLNTTLGIVATNADLDRVAATKVAQMAQDGLTRVVVPAHTMMDGDTVFAASAGHERLDADSDLVGTLAAVAMAQAIASGVRHATPAFGIPAVNA